MKNGRWKFLPTARGGVIIPPHVRRPRPSPRPAPGRVAPENPRRRGGRGGPRRLLVRHVPGGCGTCAGLATGMGAPAHFARAWSPPVARGRTCHGMAGGR